MLIRSFLRLTIMLLCIFAALVLLADTVGGLLPDTGVLLVSGENSQILDVSRRISLPYLPEIDLSLWSGDGRYLATLRNTPDGDQILITDTGGKPLLAPYPDIAQGRLFGIPAWSPDSQRVAFLFGETQAAKLVVLALNGEVLEQTLAGDLMTAQVHWLDDERVRIARVQAEQINLLEVRLHPLTVTTLAEWAFSGQINQPPVLAPDGERMLLAAYTPQLGNFEILQFLPGGQDAANLSNRRSHNDSLPEWSPDGSHIAYRMSGDGLQTILIMNADGTESRILWRERSITISRLRWSADGERLAYVRYHPQESALCVLSIYAVEPECMFTGQALRSAEWKPAS